MDGAMSVAQAVELKEWDIARQEESLRASHLLHNGHHFYADEDSLATITTALAVVQMLADTDPIPTPPPVAGCWMSADMDAGQRVVVPMTCAAFKLLARALYDRNALLWGAKQIHYATVEGMAAAGATAAEILAYDHLRGWPE